MTTNTPSSTTPNGILEQLEEYVRFKINVIRGLMDLRSDEPNEKCTKVFEDVHKTFTELDGLVDTLADKLEGEKSFVKYIHSLLKSNELQISNLVNLSKLVEGRPEFSYESVEDKKTESSDRQNTLKTTNSLKSISNNFKNRETLNIKKSTALNKRRPFTTGPKVPQWKVR